MTTRAVLLLLLGVTALHSASAVSLSRPGAQKRRPSVAAAARQLSGPKYGRPTGSSGPANGLVTKLLALPTPRSGVDSVAVERILRTTDGLQGKQLLEVLNKTADEFGLAKITSLTGISLRNGKLQAQVRGVEWTRAPSLKAAVRKFGARVQQLAR